MKPPAITLLKARLRKVKMIVRIWYLKKCGLKIVQDSIIGNIISDWPNNVIIGNKCELQDNILFRVQQPFNENNYIRIGNRVFIGNDCEFNSGANITIGDDCLIASRTIFVDGGHETNISTTIKQQQVFVESINIEEDVWIGTNCKILKGVTIGKGSIVGAGSVVNKSIPPYQIWAGCPAKYIKNR